MGQGMRTSPRFVAALFTGIAIVTATVGLTVSPAAAAGTFAVLSPSLPFAQDNPASVVVQGSGFETSEPGTNEVSFYQCTSSAMTACSDKLGEDIVDGTNINATLTGVKRVFSSGPFTYECDSPTYPQCVLVADPDVGDEAFANVSWDTAAPTPLTTVAPGTTGLVTPAALQVSGTDYPGSQVSVGQCKSSPLACTDVALATATITSGAFGPTALTATQQFVENSVTYDCLPANDCFLRFISDNTVQADIPITFTAPPPPPPPPTSPLAKALCAVVAALQNSPISSFIAPLLQQLGAAFACAASSALSGRNASTPLSCDELRSLRADVESVRAGVARSKSLPRAERSAQTRDLTRLRAILDKEIRKLRCSVRTSPPQPKAQSLVDALRRPSLLLPGSAFSL